MSIINAARGRNIVSGINAKLTETDTGAKKVIGIICPDNVRRTFYVTGTYSDTDNSLNGFIQVNRVSVSGYTRRTQGGGYRFYPHIGGKNVHLVRPDALPLGTAVTIKDSKVNGTIVAIGWNYLTPSYSVQPVDRRRKPIVEQGADNLAVL